MRYDLTDDKQINKLISEQLFEHGFIEKCDQQITIQNIDAGTVNQNIYVAYKEKEFLFKIFARNTILPIDRKKVFLLQSNLAQIGLATKPLFLSHDNHYYGEEWLSNNRTLLDEQKRSDNIHSKSDDSLLVGLAEALYRVHSCQILAPILDLPEHFAAYWSQIDKPSVALSQEYEGMLSFCIQHFEDTKNNGVLCHNDLNMAHVCLHENIIFDWEYAAYGCKYFDIANCILINEFSTEQTERLCTHYANLTGLMPEQVYQSVQNVRKLSEFTSKLWRYTIGQEPILE